MHSITKLLFPSEIFLQMLFEVYILKSVVECLPSGTNHTLRLQFVLAPVWIGIPKRKTCSPCKLCFSYSFCFSTLQRAFCLWWISCNCMTAIYKQTCNCVSPVAISCGPAPDAPAKGQRSGSGRIFKSTVTYTCNRGYTLQGDNTRTCTGNGQWSGTAPTCNRKLLTIRCSMKTVGKFYQFKGK